MFRLPLTFFVLQHDIAIVQIPFFLTYLYFVSCKDKGMKRLRFFGCGVDWCRLGAVEQAGLGNFPVDLS